MSHIESTERKRAEEEIARLTGAQQVRWACWVGLQRSGVCWSSSPSGAAVQGWPCLAQVALTRCAKTPLDKGGHRHRLH
jgi:hypothetical protein